ncbi:hypothetical protein GW17_00046702 [Ensete ventricosum]|nr:hypothetical protein GW17_00046702 [Ensete ventricosum]
MNRVNYEFEYKIALTHFKTKHLGLKVEEGPYTTLPEDDNVPMEVPVANELLYLIAKIVAVFHVRVVVLVESTILHLVSRLPRTFQRVGCPQQPILLNLKKDAHLTPTSDGLFEGQETKRSPRGKHLRHWRRLKRVWH